MMKSLNIEGVRFSYDVEGDGYPVVLMHGWGCNHTTVASIQKVLVPSFKVFNVDFPGFGDSSEPESVWGIDKYTRLIEEFVKIENIKAPILIGHSFGGRVGILFSSRNETKKLVLTDAAGIKPRHSLKYYYKVYTYKTVKRLLPIVFGKAGAQQLLDRYRSRVGSSDYNNASPMMRAILSRVVNEDLKDRLPLVQCPTLLVWGTNDTATPIRDAKTMEKLIPDAGLVAFDGCGHYSFLDNPYQYAAVLKSFLKDDMKK